MFFESLTDSLLIIVSESGTEKFLLVNVFDKRFLELTMFEVSV